MKIFLRYLALGVLLTSFHYDVVKAMDASCPHCDGLRDECFTIKPSVRAKGVGATGKWKDKITPKRGWTCIKAEDLGKGNYLQCEMCEKEKPRYIHHMVHGRSKPLKVGCKCSAYMEGRLDGDNYLEENIAAAKQRKNRLERRGRFPDLQAWEQKQNGSLYIDYKKRDVLIFSNNEGETYRASITRRGALLSSHLIPDFYGSIRDAQLAVFDYINPQ